MEATEMGQISGRTSRITAVETRIERIVAEAADLNHHQVERLRSIMTNAMDRIDAARK